MRLKLIGQLVDEDSGQTFTRVSAYSVESFEEEISKLERSFNERNKEEEMWTGKQKELEMADDKYANLSPDDDIFDQNINQVC